MKRLSWLFLLPLAACVSPPPPDQPDRDACKASAYQGLVGQSRLVLGKMMLPAGSRVIGPNDPVTMDYRAERLNIEIGPDDRIARIGCY